MAETSPVYTWLITGANRGIGFELTRQLIVSPSNIVLAACRNPSAASALHELAQSAVGRVHILPLDLTDRQSVRDSATAVADIVGERGVDYLINNAAISVPGGDSPFTLQPELTQKLFETNAVAPAYVTQVYLPLVERSTKKTVVNVSSELGSIGADKFGTRSTSYSISKAALNMLTYKQQKERPDIVFISMCPGWLKTDMGGKEAPNDVSVGVEGVLKTIGDLTPEDSGKFFNFQGTNLPW
ncbi:NAD-P-binding protein [Lenzites betulinus]|nr:NAD-P-binding protein [Lenzites betulinus]